MMYKITFYLNAPVCFVERPVFDGILAACFLKERDGGIDQKLVIAPENLETFDALPIDRHPDGYFRASWLLYDEQDHLESTGSWKKRWANEHDGLVNFKGKKRKVRINAGEFKSYNMPLVLHHLEKCWFYFESEQVEEVRKLLKHLWGIGKKTAQGYGEFSKFEIEKVNFDPFETEGIIRPIPIKESELSKILRPFWMSCN